MVRFFESGSVMVLQLDPLPAEALAEKVCILNETQVQFSKSDAMKSQIPYPDLGDSVTLEEKSILVGLGGILIRAQEPQK